MDKLRITGGRPLEGEIRVSGAKNAALPIMCAALLSEKPLALDNVPRLMDVATMAKLLARMGVEVGPQLDGRIELHAARVSDPQAPYELVKTMRASVLVLGPLLARCGRARVSLPGGCAIGQRPVDQHVKGLQAMGANIAVEHGYMDASAERLRGARIVMDLVTVTGTENLMMAATLAEGTTVLENAAREPEVVDLARCLTRDGRPDRRRRQRRDPHRRGRLARRRRARGDARPDRDRHLPRGGGRRGRQGAARRRRRRERSRRPSRSCARRARASTVEGDAIAIEMAARPRAVSLRTAPYPGFATDMQAQFMALNAIARGTALITETIFENRFMHALELQRLGAEISIQGNTAVVSGVERLQGASVMATDLRASAGLVIAGLVAEGQTVIERIYHLDRGYEALENKLAALGARVERIH